MLVYYVHARHAARPARAEYCGGGLEHERGSGGVEGSVHERHKSSGRVCIVHGRAEHETVSLPGERRKFVDFVVKHAFSRFSAAQARSAVGDRLVADKEILRPHALGVQPFFDFLQCPCGAARGARTSVYEYYLHICLRIRYFRLFRLSCAALSCDKAQDRFWRQRDGFRDGNGDKIVFFVGQIRFAPLLFADI